MLQHTLMTMQPIYGACRLSVCTHIPVSSSAMMVPELVTAMMTSAATSSPRNQTTSTYSIHAVCVCVCEQQVYTIQYCSVYKCHTHTPYVVRDLECWVLDGRGLKFVLYNDILATQLLHTHYHEAGC